MLLEGGEEEEGRGEERKRGGRRWQETLKSSQGGRGEEMENGWAWLQYWLTTKSAKLSSGKSKAHSIHNRHAFIHKLLKTIDAITKLKFNQSQSIHTLMQLIEYDLLLLSIFIGLFPTQFKQLR